MRRTAMVATMVAALVLSIVGSAAAAHLDLEGAEEWRNNRNGFSSVTWNDGILTTTVNQKGWTKESAGTTYTSHGLRSPDFDEPRDTISVDVYLDEKWHEDQDNTAVAARLMGTGTGDPVTWPVIEFTRIDGFEGFRYYESWRAESQTPRAWAAGNTLEDLGVNYGDWVTLSITTNTETHHFEYAVNGTKVGGTSYFGPNAGKFDHAILQTEFFEDDVHKDVVNNNYGIQWRGRASGQLFDGSDAPARDEFKIDVGERDPELRVSVEVDGPTELEVGDFGDYTATVWNRGHAIDRTLTEWNLGLEVESLTNVDELALEFCRSAAGPCFDVADIDDVELKLVGDVVQVLGSAEADIEPAYFETFHFRAAFKNAGSFTGTVYVLTDID